MHDKSGRGNALYRVIIQKQISFLFVQHILKKIILVKYYHSNFI